MVRQIHLGDQTIVIQEGEELENEAGAVVWDAALVLIHFLVHTPGKL